MERMHGYPVFLAIAMGLLGSYLSVVFLQLILDSLSCILIYLLAERLRKGAGLLSGLIAAFSIGMITYSHFILNDSLFLFVFLLLLMAILNFLRDPSWTWCLIVGFGIGCSAYIRQVVIYLPIFLAPLLFSISFFIKKYGSRCPLEG